MSGRDAPAILLSAGEPSGDLHGAAVARALRARWPAARLFGLGGPLMAAAGVELLADFERLAVMGFAEVMFRIPYFLRLLGRVTSEMRARGADVVIPIDYPGFNLRLARAARARRVPVLYYIAPQVWAWHRSRTGQLARSVDRLAVILPFEEALFRDAGARVEFVGHPLLEGGSPPADEATFREGLGLRDEPILALFPGSRRQEVSHHLDLFTDAARLVRERHPAVRPVIARSAAVPEDVYDGSPFPRTDDGRALLAHASAALVKSGTTTLEAALAGTPLVIAYRTSVLTFALARRLVSVEHIGLVNLVAERLVAPEFVQDEATPTALADALTPLLDAGSPARSEMVAALASVRERLHAAGGAAGPAERVAGLVAELLEGGVSAPEPGSGP